MSQPVIEELRKLSLSQLRERIVSSKKALNRLSADDSIERKFYKNINKVTNDCIQHIKYVPDDFLSAEAMKNKRIEIYEKERLDAIKQKLDGMLFKMKHIIDVEEEIERRTGVGRRRTRKEEQDRRVIIERVLKQKITLREKLEKLRDILDEKELKRLVYCIEDVDDIENFMVSDAPKKMEFGVSNKWRARFFRREKDLIFLRLSLCMKIVHTAWKTGDFESSIRLFRNGRISDEDGEGIFNYKTGTLTFNGVLYHILPESPDLVDQAFSTHEGLFEKWKDFNRLFNLNGIDCVPEKDKCVSSEPKICMSHKDMIKDMDYHCLRPHYYFPTYGYIHSGNVPRF